MTTTMEKTSPMASYRILGFTTSNEDDSSQWFMLEIKLHASRFRISVSPFNFHNSAVRSDEFQKYFTLLLSEKTTPMAPSKNLLKRKVKGIFPAILL